MINPRNGFVHQYRAGHRFLAGAVLAAALMVSPIRAEVAATTQTLQVVPCQEIDWPMAYSPELKLPGSYTTFHPRLLQLWLAALDRPEVETRRQAADAITLATQKGLKTAREQAGPKLLAILDSTFTATRNQTVLQLSCAQALVTIEYSPAADSLLKLTTSGEPQFCLLIDPALAKLKNTTAIAEWKKRLKQPHGASASLVSAIEALVTTHQTDAIASLEKLALDSTQTLTVRRAAARALATLAPEGQDTRATELYTDHASLANRLVAQTLIGGSRSPAAETLLLKMIDDSEPAIITPAVKQLAELNPKSLATRQLSLSQNSDAYVRAALIPALTRQQTTSASSLLIHLLADVQIANRNAARKGLAELYQNSELRPAISSELQKLVDAPKSTPWYQLEEIIHLAIATQDKAIAERLLSLLEHPQFPVRLAVIQAYRSKLDLDFTQPNTKMLQRAEKLVAHLHSAKMPGTAAPIATPESNISIELAQLLQTLATNHVLAVAPICESFIPKQSGNETLRQAAIWSLGKLYQNNPQPAIMNALKGRINDTAMIQGELSSIRVACMVALGQMKASTEEAFIRGWYQKNPEPLLKLAARWSLMQINGQPLPELPPNASPATGFFLEPLE